MFALTNIISLNCYNHNCQNSPLVGFYSQSNTGFLCHVDYFFSFMFDTFFAFETPWVTEYETFAKCDSWFYHELILWGFQSCIVLFLIWFLCFGGIKMQFELYQNIKCTWKGGQDLVRVRRLTDRSIFSITCRSTAVLTTCDNLILWRTIEEWNPDRPCDT